MQIRKFHSIDSQKLRFWTQAGFVVLCLWIGIEFLLWFQFHQGTGSIYVPRPPGVEGFLPISALMSLYYWALSGNINSIHPAGMTILVAIILMSVLFKKSFCSWLCPVGTISESIAEFGKKIFGRNFVPWKWLDYFFRSIKYLLLGYLIYAVFFMMDELSLNLFLESPYNRVADIKMLIFFRDISRFSLIVIGLLVFFSLFIKNFWCRYLCPYGALLGITSLLSPFRIVRKPSTCTSCGECAAACPSAIKVDKVKTVVSDECTSCMACVSVCPVPDTLRLTVSQKTRRQVRPAYVAVGVTVIFLLVTGLAMLTGNWHSSIEESEYSRRIKDINNPVYQHNQGSAPQE